jgi:hypothetical protein
MSDYAMLSLFFSFFLTMFMLSLVMVVGEASVRRAVPQKEKAKK